MFVVLSLAANIFLKKRGVKKKKNNNNKKYGLTEEQKRDKYTDYLMAERALLNKRSTFEQQLLQCEKRKSGCVNMLGKALRSQRHKVSLKDFTLVRVIGKGAFGEVRIVREQNTKQVYAMKTMRKRDMIAKNQATHVEAERNLMAGADSPWLVKLHFSFQDDTYLYLVMEFCGGGDLMNVLMRQDILTEKTTRFYMAELAAAINAVHELDFVHRFDFFFFFFLVYVRKWSFVIPSKFIVLDLKPDNILIANDGHIKLSDFGLAKSFRTENDDMISQYQEKAESLDKADTDEKEDSVDTTEQMKATRAKYKERERSLMFSTVGTPDYIAPE
ncbi:Serine/threonine-protein kinase CBK1, partial [Reticulomyxa filosa]